MRKSNIVIVFKLGIILLLLWSLVLLIFLSAKEKNTETIKLPKRFEKAIIIQPSKWVRGAVEELTLNADYQPIYVKILQKIKDNSTSKNKKTGINLLAPIVYISDSMDGKPMSYLLGEIESEADFYLFAKSLGKKALVQDKYAFLLLSESFKLPSSFKEITIKKDESLIYLSKNNQLSVSVKESEIIFKGDITNKFTQEMRYQPKETGLFIHMPMDLSIVDSAKIPFAWETLLQNIEYVSMDYKGMKVDEKGAFPIMNAVFLMRNEWEVKDWVEAISSQSVVVINAITTKRAQVQLGEQNYILQKLSEREWFFGENEKNVIDSKQQANFVLKGDISMLTKVQGNFLINAGLNFIPGFTPSKQLLQKIKTTTIEIVPSKGKNRLEGKIVFKDNQAALMALLNFFLDWNG